MFASNLFGSEDERQGFLDDVESLLRRGQPDVAAGLLEGQLGDLADDGDELARLCIKVPVSAVRITGWEQLAGKLEKLDRPGRPITAIGIDISAPFEMPELDDRHGNFYEPDLDTVYYTDSAFPFASASREMMMEEAQNAKAAWVGHFENVDATIGVRGLGGIYGEVLIAQKKCKDYDHKNAMEQDSAVIASAFIAVRLHQAIKATAEGRGMPRAACLMVGNNESFPYYDAPVMTRPEYEEYLDAEGEEDDCGQYDHAFGTLRLAPLPDDYDPFAAMPDEDQVSGAALRKKLRAQAEAETPEVANDVAPAGIGGFLNRILKRSA
ncbi:hypothetical protein [Croceicoccus naphthovorans]|uniref:Uncharacterized protein n=1 Tax=Croceicoccus naphthovorans TaxID=1348774 RepID=A0A0G3XJ32_9SPHN|nr:hypothetical protein [Croceicoccus naphthovorans]AKM10388.1 hypothetical protein AB433_11145 [Croceicoccus naphthovorans]MBB3990085.1 hypothetical protein [Croceicoccus naphthovorans]